MAAGALSRAVSVIDDRDGTWISNPRGTYGAGNINRYKTPVKGLKNRQLKAVNVNQLHPPYSTFFHLADAGELRGPPCLICPVLLLSHQGLAGGGGGNRFPALFAFNYGSCLNLPNPKTRTEESRMVASSCRQSDRDKTLFGYLSTGVKPSIAVIAPFHTSANANFSCMNIGFMFSSYFQILCFLGEYLMKCLPCIFLQNRWQLIQNFEK